MEFTTQCPKCGYAATREDVCEACGALLSRIRRRQEGASPDAAEAMPYDDDLVRASAISYEMPASSNFFTKTILIVLLLGGGYFGVRHFTSPKATPSNSQYVHEFESKLFDEQVLNAPAGETWVIDFFATWCGPCKQFAPEFDATADKLGTKASFARIDVDIATAVAQRYSIHAIPTVAIFRNGKMITSQTGGMRREDFERWINSNI